ncbi:hypothetical protein RHMOL_Rhmol08G0047400 [Rhododendron molle]|uniref:Uncharacterized protein n=1 Tax=Rhododendron molle TaxID=49168 RepID=A0ACC0MJN7_RHOML|nr:hypothetical protein RHMOL_Rhmol08G0047400 [Rhododendron molle]
MEESFRVRVDKTFGSLASASSSSSSSSSSNTAASASLSSLWSLTDEELERKEWNRERDDGFNDAEPKPYPPNLDGFFANRSKIPPRAGRVAFKQEIEADLEDLDDDGVDDDEEEEERKKRELVKPDDYNDEEWDIRSSIGLDCTLDFEEEDDKYDKVAVGMEKADDRLYMRDITGYWTDINFYNELPNTFKDASRDPRANHMAAKLRLKEDAEAAGKFGSLQVSDTGLLVPNTQNIEEGVNPKSILKRKENQVDPKTQKRVRFVPGCNDDCEEDYEGTKDVAMGNCSTQAEKSEASFPSQEFSVVPDYIRNPSQYTHYTFDSSSDSDEESNQKAYMDFLNQQKSSNSTEPQRDYTSSNLPKSIAFTPKKKLGDALLKNGNELEQNQGDAGKEIMPKKGGPAIVITAVEVPESEVCKMEEDEPENVATKNSSLRRQGRQYRTRADIELDEPVT